MRTRLMSGGFSKGLNLSGAGSVWLTTESKGL